jgi:hypothetical protein
MSIARLQDGQAVSMANDTPFHSCIVARRQGGATEFARAGKIDSASC